jgi:hypothetical protein
MNEKCPDFVFFSISCFSTAISQLEGSSVPHGLTLQLGDLVEITQICEGKNPKILSDFFAGSLCVCAPTWFSSVYRKDGRMSTVNTTEKR